MGRRGITKAIEAGRREDGLGAATVGRAGRALHEPVGDETVDQPGNSRAAQEHAFGEDVHPEPAVRRRGELEERVVFRQRKAVLVSQLVVEAPADAGVRLEKGPPGRQPRVRGCEVRGFRSHVAIIRGALVDGATRAAPTRPEARRLPPPELALVERCHSQTIAPEPVYGWQRAASKEGDSVSSRTLPAEPV